MHVINSLLCYDRVDAALFTPILGIVATAWQCSLEQGQIYIDEGRYRDAIREFRCVIEGQPTEVEGYRGRIEAELLLGRYSGYFPRLRRITAFVLPAHLATRPGLQPCLMIISALTGASFVRCCFFDYPAAIHLLNDPPAVSPNNGCGNPFRGSSRLLKVHPVPKGQQILIERSPSRPKVPVCA